MASLMASSYHQGDHRAVSLHPQIQSPPYGRSGLFRCPAAGAGHLMIHYQSCFLLLYGEIHSLIPPPVFQVGGPFSGALSLFLSFESCLRDGGTWPPHPFSWLPVPGITPAYSPCRSLMPAKHRIYKAAVERGGQCPCLTREDLQ